jgi:hypothetical protein
MSKTSTIALFVAELAVVSLLALGLYFRTVSTYQVPLSLPVANVVSKSDVQPEALSESLKAAAPLAARSVYVSEQSLKRGLALAAEHPWSLRARDLWRKLNYRYEHRCCGFPR